MPCAERKLTICTPYFNLPALLVRNIIQLLRSGKQVEIIVGDKTANDFYIPEDQPFKIIGALPICMKSTSAASSADCSIMLILTS